jgi:hypothetical protein
MNIENEKQIPLKDLMEAKIVNPAMGEWRKDTVKYLINDEGFTRDQAHELCDAIEEAQRCTIDKQFNEALRSIIVETDVEPIDLGGK